MKITLSQNEVQRIMQLWLNEVTVDPITVVCCELTTYGVIIDAELNTETAA